jgi:hypothetical protein
VLTLLLRTEFEFFKELGDHCLLIELLSGKRDVDSRLLLMSHYYLGLIDMRDHDCVGLLLFFCS